MTKQQALRLLIKEAKKLQATKEVTKMDIAKLRLSLGLSGFLTLGEDVNKVKQALNPLNKRQKEVLSSFGNDSHYTTYNNTNYNIILRLVRKGYLYHNKQKNTFRRVMAI